MNRRQLLRTTLGAAAAAGIGRPSIVRSASATTLKFVPYADLALLDPLANALVTRNHVLMVFDTLFALDANGDAQYQMLAGHTVDADQFVWTLTLRDGLLFHDNTPVLARDVVASLRRWAVKDPFGQALMAATSDLSAPNDKQIVFRLSRPFPLLLQSLGVSNRVPPTPVPFPIVLMQGVVFNGIATPHAPTSSIRSHGHGALPLSA